MAARDLIVISDNPTPKKIEVLFQEQTLQNTGYLNYFGGGEISPPKKNRGEMATSKIMRVWVDREGWKHVKTVKQAQEATKKTYPSLPEWKLEACIEQLRGDNPNSMGTARASHV